MSVHGTFTYGLPGETKDQMLDTKKFISMTNFNTVQSLVQQKLKVLHFIL